MNKIVFKRVKDKCAKDMGLSDKAYQEIADKFSDGLTEDSSDEDIDKVVNQCVSFAKVIQREATRWAQKNEQTEKDKSKDYNAKDDMSKNGGQDEDVIPEWFKKEQEKNQKFLQELQDENKKLIDQKKKGDRDSFIQTELQNAKIPEYLAKRMRFGDDMTEDDIKKEITEYRQDLITNKLMPEDSEGSRVGKERAIEEQGKSLFEQYVVKTNN